MNSLESISIALVGEWNTKIFTPNWIMKELLELKEDGEIQVGFTNELQSIYHHSNIQLIPSEKVFEIKLKKNGKKEIELANRIVIKLITSLPFTPKLAVGFNFKMKQKCDLTKISVEDFSDEYNLTEIKLSKEGRNYIENVIMNCNQKKYILYNFHYKDIAQIKENAIYSHLQYLQDK